MATSQAYGALWGYGARTDRIWAAQQAKNVAMLRARGRAVAVHQAPVPSARAYHNAGRWIIDCGCRNGVIVDVGFGTARCFECGAVYAERQIRLPKSYTAIERELLRLYPHDATLRDWRPGQRLRDLRGRHHSWTAPRTWVTGELVTASIGNTHWKDNLTALRDGSIAIASQAALDFIFGSSATQLGRLAAGSALQVPRINAAGTAWEFADVAQQVTLLKANSGSSTTATAENVDTIAISGLTAKDTIQIYYQIQSDTAGTAEVNLYSTTDSADLNSLSANTAITLGEIIIGQVTVRQNQAGATIYDAVSSGILIVQAGEGNGDTPSRAKQTTGLTAWTGSWTLALRQGGVTATGTFRWSWAVFRVKGQ